MYTFQCGGLEMGQGIGVYVLLKEVAVFQRFIFH